MPRRSAAMRLLPPTSASMCLIAFFSASSRRPDGEGREPEETTEVAEQEDYFTACGKSSTSIIAPGASKAQTLTRFFSSLTFPGQS